MIASANVRRVVYRDDRETVLECGHVTLSAVGGEFTRCAECACEQPEAPEYSAIEAKAMEDVVKAGPSYGSVLRDPACGRLIVFHVSKNTTGSRNGGAVYVLRSNGGFDRLGILSGGEWSWRVMVSEGLADLARQAWERSS